MHGEFELLPNQTEHKIGIGADSNERIMMGQPLLFLISQRIPFCVRKNESRKKEFNRLCQNILIIKQNKKGAIAHYHNY